MTFFQGLPALALFVLVAVFAGAIILGSHLFFGSPDNKRRRSLDNRQPAETNDVVFLFDGPILHDATKAAHLMIEGLPNPKPGKAEIGAFLGHRFPGLQKQLSHDGATFQTLPAADTPATTAKIDKIGETLRLTIHLNDADEIAVHPLAMSAMRDELSALRHIGETSPQLIWKLGANDAVVWANAAYLSLVDQIEKPAPGLKSDWPPILLFSDLKIDATLPSQRANVFNPSTQTQEWYDITSSPCQGGSILFANCASAIVKADEQSKVFVQTLTKTFAELSTGLAIFDRSRRLVMFNPTLIEMTQLPISFLSGQPVFRAVLDRLRDGGMLPEPKNYSTWRAEVAALEVEAENGTYSEIWTMPGGQTYRVTGRPHPNGALAFLIDDISAEITRTRTFRSEREITQGVVDALDEAIAVFSRTGALIMSNAQYDEDWSEKDPKAGSNLTAELAFWQKTSVPNPVWTSIHTCITATTNRRPTTETIRLPDGRSVSCRVAPLVGGASLIGFRYDAVAQPPGEVDAVHQNLKRDLEVSESR